MLPLVALDDPPLDFFAYLVHLLLWLQFQTKETAQLMLKVTHGHTALSEPVPGDSSSVPASVDLQDDTRLEKPSFYNAESEVPLSIVEQGLCSTFFPHSSATRLEYGVEV